MGEERETVAMDTPKRNKITSPVSKFEVIDFGP